MNRLEEALAALDNDVLAGAKALLGLNLVKGEMRARIVEVEAYRTPDDPACHAHRGVTPRNEVMFGPAGRAYVYFNYGVHWMLNVTAHSQGDAAAVLIRAAQPVNGLVEMRGARSSTKSDRDLLSGPGKLAAAYGITGELNGINLFSVSSCLRLEEGPPVESVLVGPRIGIRLGVEHLWRFIDAEALGWASRPCTGLVPL